MKYAYFIIFSVTISFCLGFYIARNTNIFLSEKEITALREVDDEHTFIRPLLACLEDENKPHENLNSLKNTLEVFVKKAQGEGIITSASIYFRDLNEGQWTGVFENEIYSPASLLKIPVMIAYLREAETKPELLNKTFTYIKSPTNINPLIDESILRNGETYTAEELMRGMIVDSDNDAKDLLVKALDKKILGETYSRLHIENPYESEEEKYRISTKTYGLFFRTLYNATVLSRDMSEKALELLSQSKFAKGLRAGISPDTPIAHKYGVRVSRENADTPTVELSDCGIAYNEESPFLLCIMTKGKDPYVLSDFIAKTAEMVENNLH